MKSTNEERNWALIKRLREEANYVKDCFTRFSFWVLGFSCAMIGFVAKFQDNCPYVGFVSGLVTIIILSVARIGIYKYGTANRNFGYELHLNRIETLAENSNTNNGWKAHYVNIGWEEAMRAWRIVQPTVSHFLYDNTMLKYNILRKEHEKPKHKWFDPTSNVCEYEAIYYSGGYLRTMLSILHTIACISVVPLMFMDTQFLVKKNYLFFVIGVFVTIWALLQVIARIIKNTANRRLLERGLFSIHSCGILWQATIIAHYRALDIIQKKYNRKTYRKYTNYLSKEASNICKYIFDIHYWIDNPEQPTKFKEDGTSENCVPLTLTFRKVIENEKTKSKTFKFLLKKWFKLL